MLPNENAAIGHVLQNLVSTDAALGGHGIHKQGVDVVNLVLDGLAALFAEWLKLAGNALVFAGRNFGGFDALGGLRFGHVGVRGHHADGADVGGGVSHVNTGAGGAADPVRGAGHGAAGQGGDGFFSAGHNVGQGDGAVYRAAGAVNGEDDAVHRRVSQGGLEVALGQLGADAAADVHKEVGALGNDAFELQDGDAVLYGVAFLLGVVERAAQAGLNDGEVNFVAAQVGGVDGLDFEQLGWFDGPGRGDDVQQLHREVLSQKPAVSNRAN